MLQYEFFPSFTFASADGNEIYLPGDPVEGARDPVSLPFLEPYCNAQRAVFSPAAGKCDDEGIRAVSVSVVLNPEGRILTAIYWNRAICRQMPDDALNFVRHLNSSRNN